MKCVTLVGTFSKGVNAIYIHALGAHHLLLLAGKVDLLMGERKEAKEAVQAQADTLKQAQAQANSFQMLMPLALPAPQQPGMMPSDAGFGMPAPGMYGAAAGYTGQGY
jgi:hypothetical protein